MSRFDAVLVRFATWSKAPARSRHMYATAAAIGLVAYVVVYGPGHLLGTNAYWAMPAHDERMAMMGYRYFLHAPWQWPVFVSDAINVPYSGGVAFWDCVPLWALINKVIATLVPPWGSFSMHGYLGLWHGLVYVLQACLGVAILRALGHRSWREGIVTVLLFLAVPAWIFRYGHSALSAHWVELWAIYLYLRMPARGPAPIKLGLGWLAQLSIGSLICPYHPAMSLGVFVASLLRTRDVRTFATWLPLGVACVVAMTGFAGYFAHEALIPQWGFHAESTNLLSWLVPVRSGIIGDGRWIANVMATDWQYEGLAYLGLGCLGLLALFVFDVRTLPGVISRHRFLFAAALVLWLFALSNHIYFGGHEVATYSIPRLLRWIPQQFRSPGRFVWIPMYVLIVYLLHWAFVRFATGRRFAVLVIAAAVQLVDARGEWQRQRTMARDPSPILDLGAWRRLIHAHEAVFIHPTHLARRGAHVCEGPDEIMPQLTEISLEIQMLASERWLPINGTYNTRPTRNCEVEARAWPTVQLDRNTLYVLLPTATAIADRFEAAGAHCAAFDLGRVCSTNEAAIGDAIQAGILRPPPVAIVLRYGQPLELGAALSLDAGWSKPEPGGRWTGRALASLLLHLDGDPPPMAVLKLQAASRLCGARTAQDVDVFLDDRPLTTLHFDASTNDGATVRTLTIPDTARLRRRAFALQLRPHDIRSPAALRCDTDARSLGVWVSRLWFDSP